MTAKRFEKVLIHIGPDKTGSTAIQHALFQGRERLQKSGILYSNGFARNDQLLTLKCCGLSRFQQLSGRSSVSEELVNKAQRYFELLQRQFENAEGRKIILSHEGLVHLNKDELKFLKEFLRKYTDCIEIVLYVRDPVSYAKSAISQRTVTGRKTFSSDVPILFYKDYIEKFIAVFGKQSLRVRKFERVIFPDGNIVLDFLSLCIPDVDERQHVARNISLEVNPSLSMQGVYVGQRILKLLGDKAPRDREYRELFADKLLQLDDVAYDLAPWAKLVVLFRSRKHMKYVEKEYGIFFTTRFYEFISFKRKSSIRRAEIHRKALKIIGEVAEQGLLTDKR